MSESSWCLEANHHAATLYLSGPVSMSSILRPAASCQGLPVSISTLRVDMRATTLADPEALTLLHRALTRWRSARDGCVRIAAANATRSLDLTDHGWRHRRRRAVTMLLHFRDPSGTTCKQLFRRENARSVSG